MPAPRFSLIKECHTEIKKEYTADIVFTREHAMHESAVLVLNAEEVMEVYVNGQLAGVSFWAPYEIDLKPFLNPREISCI